MKEVSSAFLSRDGIDEMDCFNTCVGQLHEAVNTGLFGGVRRERRRLSHANEAEGILDGRCLCMDDMSHSFAFFAAHFIAVQCVIPARRDWLLAEAESLCDQATNTVSQIWILGESRQIDGVIEEALNGYVHRTLPTW